MDILTRVLEILGRTDPVELTTRFIELYEAVTETMAPMDQEAAKAALEARRLDNDEGHARLQALLEQAKNR